MLKTGKEQTIISVIGLGYVGLPLAISFAKKFKVVGFDIDARRIEELQNGIDRTNEVSTERLNDVQSIEFTSDPKKLVDSNTYIVTVPTPIDKWKRPNLDALESASRLVGGLISTGNTVIYESTVYPGVTEEFCGAILSKESGLTVATADDQRCNTFYLGYSPERVNYGDHNRTIENIVKLTSGSTPQAAAAIDKLYSSIVSAGTFRASSIRVAEAAKVIENVQRDVNIALVNEFALIFDKLNIDTQAVLEAAKTKWNFLPFWPGLVGGHCIGVDPFYLTHKAIEVGHNPEIILAGRRLNDNMSKYVSMKIIKSITSKISNLVEPEF